MAIALKTDNLKKYRDIAWLLMKYSRSDLMQESTSDVSLPGEEQEDHSSSEAAELADDLEKLGPTFIKVGQLLSSRAELLPVSYLEALARLQDKVEPFSFADVEEIVASELGVRLSKAFSHFEAVPLAAASLGQVHRAALRDGRAVVVKVQRPKIRQQIIQDLEVLGEAAGFLDKHTQTGRRYEFQRMLDEFRKTILSELDYRQEARNLVTIAKNLENFDRIVIPSPVEDYTTSRVLTMDYIRGQKVTDLGPLRRMEIDGRELAEQLFRAYLEQTLVHGFFHADPHPGNVFLTSDGRVALIDLGMVARISSNIQDDLLKLILASSEGRSEDAASVAINIGERREHFDETRFRRRIADVVERMQGAPLEDLEIGRIVLEISHAAADEGVRLPSDMTMLGKTLMNLDHVGRTLDPQFNPNDSIRRNSTDIMQLRLRKSLSPGNVYQTILELKDFAQAFPRRVNRILDNLANDQLRIRIELRDRGTILDSAQKIANRITLGLLLAALIIGAALMMRIPTNFQILGYPGLAIIFFLLAAAGGLALAYRILILDERRRK